ncbi:MAG: AlkA N-terminal domain-containing protein [Gemmatimonadaceae bacterium]
MPDADPAALYSAYAARDPRFDGLFFIGVTSTGIYCRPVCTARTPRAANCRFFDTAAAAEKDHFRPCLRCRPELAPGHAPVDEGGRIAALVARRIDEGMVDDGVGVEAIAAEFGWSARQIRRMMRRSLGVSPMALVMTRRLLLAKQLLTETALTVTEVAFASGFRSLRRFNDAFLTRYGMPPSRFRRAAESDDVAAGRGSFTLQLTYRPPFDWEGLLAFLAGRAMTGVEGVRGDEYLRAVRLGAHTGWVRVRHLPAKRALSVEVAHPLAPVLPALLGRLRQLFDLDARPDVITSHLATDPLMAPLVTRRPGLRVPGAFEPFELATRAVLGQQVSVRAATTLGGRLAEAFGEPLVTPFGEITRTGPSAERIAQVEVDTIAALGIVRARAATILVIAREMTTGRLRLDPGVAPGIVMRQLVALPGIGPWTAHYIAMRALRWPDAFPREDLVLRKALGGLTPAQAEARAAGWAPWRSYATLHLWCASSSSQEDS